MNVSLNSDPRLFHPLRQSSLLHSIWEALSQDPHWDTLRRNLHSQRCKLMLTHESRTENAIAASKCDLLTLSKSDFLQILA